MMHTAINAGIADMYGRTQVSKRALTGSYCHESKNWVEVAYIQRLAQTRKQRLLYPFSKVLKGAC
jgi:hypothetical protein